MSFDAALWDMDGTLVDTEPYWIEEERELLRGFGVEWSHDAALELVGNDLMDSAVALRAAGADMDPHAIIEHLIAAVTVRVREHIPFRPGARELLADMRTRGLPCALVTMSYAPLAEAVVDGLPGGTFVGLVTGENVSHGKPHPEPYFAGARLVGVPPERCVALEDSRTGLRSAVDAGTQAVGIRHLVDLDGIGQAPVIATLDGIDTPGLERVLAGSRTPSA